MLNKFQKLAENREGKCLSRKYINTQIKLKWQCSKGHKWIALPSKIQRGQWCPYCAGKHKTIKDMHKLAAVKNGKCLSNKYVTAKTKLKWKCSEWHEWTATPDNIRIGHWCPYCAGQRKTLKDMHNLAAKKEGKCLSPKYTNAKTKLEWQCVDKHVWKATPDAIKQGKWCPHCNIYICEEKCRYALNYLTHKIFLKNTHVIHPLTLDGYCEQLNLGFEYDGIIHRVYTPGIHRTRDRLAEIKKRDKNKNKVCKKRNIELLRISDLEYTADCDDSTLVNVLINKLKKINIGILKTTVDWSEFYTSLSVLNKLREVAKSRGGVLLSTTYYNSLSTLLWQCSEGHQWKAASAGVRHGSWCPYCAGHVRKTIEDMRELAISKGGRCLSKKYINAQQRLKWKCREGHTWEVKSIHIRQGSWCPYCAGKAKKTIKDMHNLAEKKDGRCVSKKYLSAHTKLMWECSKEHQWEATPGKIQQGRWCPKCANLKRYKNYAQ